jgi:EPS-associated MarR family transcriptional regulator|tara:strand:- start:585 stop:905 length:321 start_codon:yes stop_codon:yes gene_type:complete
MKNSEDHFKLLRNLNENPSSSQRKMADELGFSLGKLNYCLKELKKRGFVKVKNFKKSEKKLSYLYMLTPSGFTMKKNLTLDFMKKKIKEYEELKNEIKNIERDFNE